MLCNEHYTKWKQQALLATDFSESKKSLERAFFWLELQSAFILMHLAEQTYGEDPDAKQKLIVAKANLSKRLADYAKEILNDISR